MTTGLITQAQVDNFKAMGGTEIVKRLIEKALDEWANRPPIYCGAKTVSGKSCGWNVAFSPCRHHGEGAR